MTREWKKQKKTKQKKKKDKKNYDESMEEKQNVGHAEIESTNMDSKLPLFSLQQHSQIPEQPQQQQQPPPHPQQQPLQQQLLSIPVPTFPLRSFHLESVNQPLLNHPQSSSTFLSKSRVSAFINPRQGKKESSTERCIKATYGGDTRRFRLNITNFNYNALLQVLKETYPTLPNSFDIKYFDEENDPINITTTAELCEAYRILFSSHSKTILKLLIEDSPDKQIFSSIPNQIKNKTNEKNNNNNSSISQKQIKKRKSSPSSTSSSLIPSISKKNCNPVNPLTEVEMPAYFPFHFQFFCKK